LIRRGIGGEGFTSSSRGSGFRRAAAAVVGAPAAGSVVGATAGALAAGWLGAGAGAAAWQALSTVTITTTNPSMTNNFLCEKVLNTTSTSLSVGVVSRPRVYLD